MSCITHRTLLYAIVGIYQTQFETRTANTMAPKRPTKRTAFEQFTKSLQKTREGRGRRAVTGSGYDLAGMTDGRIVKVVKVTRVQPVGRSIFSSLALNLDLEGLEAEDLGMRLEVVETWVDEGAMVAVERQRDEREAEVAAAVAEEEKAREEEAKKKEAKEAKKKGAKGEEGTKAVKGTKGKKSAMGKKEAEVRVEIGEDDEEGVAAPMRRTLVRGTKGSAGKRGRAKRVIEEDDDSDLAERDAVMAALDGEGSEADEVRRIKVPKREVVK